MQSMMVNPTALSRVTALSSDLRALAMEEQKATTTRLVCHVSGSQLQAMGDQVAPSSTCGLVNSVWHLPWYAQGLNETVSLQHGCRDVLHAVPFLSSTGL